MQLNLGLSECLPRLGKWIFSASAFKVNVHHLLLLPIRSPGEGTHSIPVSDGQSTLLVSQCVSTFYLLMNVCTQSFQSQRSSAKISLLFPHYNGVYCVHYSNENCIPMCTSVGVHSVHFLFQQTDFRRKYYCKYWLHNHANRHKA